MLFAVGDIHGEREMLEELLAKLPLEDGDRVVFVGDYVDRPDTATILAAAKLTGRLSSGTSLGLLAAVTDAESARTSTDGVLGRTQVAPRSGE